MLTTQILYPGLMFFMLWRTVLVRVRSDALLVFTPVPEEERSGTIFARFQRSFKADQSLFSWADKGQWETAETGDERAQREGDCFRIGFEPVFVDFTKRGVWYLLISLVEVRVCLEMFARGYQCLLGLCARNIVQCAASAARVAADFMFAKVFSIRQNRERERESNMEFTFVAMRFDSDPSLSPPCSITTSRWHIFVCFSPPELRCMFFTPSRWQRSHVLAY